MRPMHYENQLSYELRRDEFFMSFRSRKYPLTVLRPYFCHSIYSCVRNTENCALLEPII